MASGRRYLCNRMHRTQWCLRIMTQADNTYRYAPTRLEDAISVTACTERSGACGWHMQMLPRVWKTLSL